MKTAILISGALRSFEKTLPNLRWMVFRHFPDADFYVCCHDDEDAHKAMLLKQHYPGRVHIKYVKQPEMEMPAGCPDVWTQGQPYMHEPYHISVPPAAVLGQLWLLREAWNHCKSVCGDSYDVIVRCRPDLWFHSFQKPHGLCHTIRLSNGLRTTAVCDDFGDVAFTPWWGRFGGINDRFAVMGGEAAESYFATFDRVEKLIEDGAPLHPESLVAASLRIGGCSIVDDMKAEFSTLRKTGEMRPPEITPIDMAHMRAG